MIGEIIAIFIVFGIFALVASLLGLYVWRVDPHRSTGWTVTALRARREARDGPTP